MPKPGSVVVVRYKCDGKPIYHERIVLCEDDGSDGTFAVVTPDGEQIDEDFTDANDDLLEIFESKGLGFRPVGLRKTPLHYFDPLPTPAQVRQWLKVARDHFQLPMPPEDLTVLVHKGAPIVARANDGFDDTFGPFGVGQDVIAPAGKGQGFRGFSVPPPGGNMTGSALGNLGLPDGTRVGLEAFGIDEMWVLDEPTVDGEIGDVVTPTPGFVTLPGGFRALSFIKGEEVVLRRISASANRAEYALARKSFLSADRRTLEASYPVDTKSFAMLVADMVTSEGRPSPLAGPATTGWFLDQVASGGMPNMMSRHHRFKADSGVRHSLPAVFEHEVLSQAIDFAILHDRLNVKNLLCIELLMRRMQLHEAAISEAPDNPSYEGARFYMGVGERRGGAMIAPSLQQFVAGEIGREAAILKEKRKAREARGKGAGGRGTKEEDGQAGADARQAGK